MIPIRRKRNVIITKVNKEITSESKNINIEKVIAESNNPKELKEIFDKIENNYHIKITRYNKEFYEKGFIDGVNLILNCFSHNSLIFLHLADFLNNLLLPNLASLLGSADGDLSF